MRYELLGFVGDFKGNQNALTYFRPALRIDGSNYVAMTDSWTRADLRVISDSEVNDFVWTLPERDREYVNEGDVVWLAGSTFVNTCLRQTPELDQVANQLASWATFEGPYAVKAGSLSGVQELSKTIFNVVSARFYRYVCGVVTAAPGALSDIRQIVDGLQLVDSFDTYLLRGVYYLVVGEPDRYDLNKQMGVALGYIPSEAEFDRAVRERQSFVNDSKAITRHVNPTAIVATARSELEQEVVRRAFLQCYAELLDLMYPSGTGEARGALWALRVLSHDREVRTDDWTLRLRKWGVGGSPDLSMVHGKIVVHGKLEGGWTPASWGDGFEKGRPPRRRRQ